MTTNIVKEQNELDILHYYLIYVKYFYFYY